MIEGCIKLEGRTATLRPHPFCPLTLKFQSSSDRTSPRDEDFMIGDFIRRGQRGRAVSIEGLTSHRTSKNLCERDALPTELYPQRWPATYHEEQIHLPSEMTVVICPSDLMRNAVLGWRTYEMSLVRNTEAGWKHRARAQRASRTICGIGCAYAGRRCRNWLLSLGFQKFV